MSSLLAQPLLNMKNDTNKLEQDKLDRLTNAIDEYMKRGMPAGELIKEHIFKEYGENGNEELEEIAKEYFIEHLD